MMEFYFLRYLLQHEKKNQNLSKLDININFYYTVQNDTWIDTNMWILHEGKRGVSGE